MNPWWHFSRWDIAYYTTFLIVAYAIFGTPDGYGWLIVAPGILLGRWLMWRLLR